MLLPDVPLLPALSLVRPQANEVPFDRIYAAHAADVARWMVHFVGPEADIEDLVHDVFAIALRQWPHFRGDARPRTWLYGIAHNVARNHRRWRKLRRFLPFDEESSPQLASLEQSADHYVEQKQAAVMVHRVLDRLSEKDRSVLVMFELQGLSGAEIAEVLCLRINTVWVRLHRAREAFVRALAAVQVEKAQ